ncbi:MAG: TetR/AcrR family transcriptional regulator [Halodesulfurarchaeum sp.]
MVESHVFHDDPEDTREAIMAATYDALCEYGYAGLTIANIAEQFEKSKSLLYHHYESKDELLLEFLSFMLEQYDRLETDADDESPLSQLERIFDRALLEERSEAPTDLLTAMVELRAQAAHDERFRDHFGENDRVFVQQLVEIIEGGIEDGVFEPVDAESVAAFLMTTLTGSMNQRVTTESEYAEAVRSELKRYLEDRLLAATPTE